MGIWGKLWVSRDAGGKQWVSGGAGGRLLVSGGTFRTIIVMILPRQFLVPFLVPAFLLFHRYPESSQEFKI